MMTKKARAPFVLGVTGALVAASVATILSAVAIAEGVLTLPVARAAMADYQVTCDTPTSCPLIPGQNVPSGQTDGKRLLVGRESADDANSDDAFALLSEIDLVDVPAGARIASATITFQLSAGQPTGLEIRGVTSAWPGAPFADLPTLGASTGVAVVADGVLIADITSLAQSAVGGQLSVALTPTDMSGFGQVYSPTANPTARRPVVELEFVTDDEAPTITLTSPTGGSQFGQIPVTADAQDNVGVDRVELWVDGELFATDGEAPWDFMIAPDDITDGPHYLTVRAVDRVGLIADDGVGIVAHNEWSTMQRLDHDLTYGLLTVDEYATFAVDLALGVGTPSDRYGTFEAPHSLTGWFVGVLGLWSDLTPSVRDELEFRLGGYDVDGDGVTPPPEPAAMATAASDPLDVECGGVVTLPPIPDLVGEIPVWCRASYPQFSITYPAFSIFDFDASDDDANGVPDDVDTMATTIAQSRQFYESTLGYPARGDMEFIVNPAGGSGLSLPGLPVIDAPIFIGASSIAGYLPAHETFHQYQYNYIDVFDYSILLPSVVGEIDSVRWYMEASAEWASHKYIAANSLSFTNYANEIDVFLSEPWDHLARNEWASTNGPQYGAFVFPEWLEERGGPDLVQEVWEQIDRGSALFTSPHVYAATDRALAARGFGDLGDNILDMWTSVYDLDFGAAASSSDIAAWRNYLLARDETKGDSTAVVSDQNRMARVSDQRYDDPAGPPAILLSAGDVASVNVPLGEFGGSVVEIKPDTDGVLYIEMNLNSHIEVAVRPLTEYGGTLCSTPTTTRVGDHLESVVPFPASCGYVAVVVANGDDDSHGGTSLEVRFGEQADRTISNGTIRLGLNPEGHLNVPGYDPSSGTGTSTVGLRYVPTNADALAPGCECEGWGIGDTVTGYSGWADNAYGGAYNLDVTESNYTDDSATSTVWLADFEKSLSVSHDVHPVPGVPYLYEIDVTVTNITSVNSDFEHLYYGPVHPIYRRVMDWDVEPTAFSEYVTIAAPGGIPPEVVYTSNDGFGSPDPFDPRSSLGAAGLFEDYGPTDQGVMVEIDLGILSTWSPRATFTMYYGAAPDEQTALDALATVGAELYSLAQPDVVGGATTGEPNTFMWGYKAGEIGGPPVLAVAATTASATAAAPATVPGEPRQ